MEEKNNLYKKANDWFWKELTYTERDKYAEQDLNEPFTEARYISKEEIIELYLKEKNETIS